MQIALIFCAKANLWNVVKVTFQNKESLFQNL